jgi:hypothetical protein
VRCLRAWCRGYEPYKGQSKVTAPRRLMR